MVAKQEKMFLTNGVVHIPNLFGGLDGFSSHVMYHFQKEQKIHGGDNDDDDDDGGDGYWSTDVEEIKWDTMFNGKDNYQLCLSE